MLLLRIFVLVILNNFFIGKFLSFILFMKFNGNGIYLELWRWKSLVFSLNVVFFGEWNCGDIGIVVKKDLILGIVNECVMVFYNLFVV